MTVEIRERPLDVVESETPLDVVESETKKPSVSFIASAYNEEASIALAVEKIHAALADVNIGGYELILVNDCSTDNTGAVIDRIAANQPNVRTVHNPVNLGFGGAFKAGARVARCDFVMSLPGNIILVPLKEILSRVGEADIILTYQQNPEVRPWMRQMISFTFTKLVNILFDDNAPYYNGLNVYRRTVLEQIEIETNGFAFHVEAVVKLRQLGHSYTSEGIDVLNRKAGKSKAFRMKNIISVSETLFRMWVEYRLRRRS